MVITFGNAPDMVVHLAGIPGFSFWMVYSCFEKPEEKKSGWIKYESLIIW